MYLQRLHINNVKCFGPPERALDLDLTRPDGSLAGFTVVAGRNGSGKTTFLRCAALALSAEDTVRRLQPSFEGWRHAECKPVEGAGVVGHVLLTRQDAPQMPDRFRVLHEVRHIAVDAADAATPPSVRYAMQYFDPPVSKDDVPREASESDSEYEARARHWLSPHREWHTSHRVLVAGYGPLRRLTGHADDARALMTGKSPESRLVSLFREDASLIECVSWLREIYLRRLEGKPGAAQLESDVLNLLRSGLLPDGIQIDRIDSDGLWVERAGVMLPLRELSDGYRTMAALVLDLVRHVYASFGDLKLALRDGVWTIPHEGVVLIDEIDAHLHVSWQQRVGFWLKRHFPGIQFIVTTHSPFVCQAADPGGIIRLPGPGDLRPGAHVSEEEFRTIVNGDVDEAVLTSLFGLDHSHSEESERLRNEVALLESRQIEGSASEADMRELEEKAAKLPDTGVALMDRALRKLGARK